MGLSICLPTLAAKLLNLKQCMMGMTYDAKQPIQHDVQRAELCSAEQGVAEELVLSNPQFLALCQERNWLGTCSRFKQLIWAHSPSAWLTAEVKPDGGNALASS